MDDPRDGPYPRAPELEDLLKLCKALDEQGARFILIGGVAVQLHGFRRTTKDIDLLVDAAPDNVRKIKAAMAVFPDNAAREVADTDVQEYHVVRIADEVVVDLLEKACGLDYDAALRVGVDKMIVENVEIPVAGKQLLIKTKDTYRPGDKMDVNFLESKIEEEKKPR